MSDTYYFVSDLHFGLLDSSKENERESLFCDFLYSIKGATKLYILGDLFDYWFEYRRVIQKGYFRTFTALHDLAKSGTEINYLIGNHDFMHRDFFEKELNVNLHYEEIEIEIEKKKFFLGHGDGLVKNDIGYLILKKILRNSILQKVFSIIHPDLGIWIASSSSRKSRNYTKTKNYGEIDGLMEAAREKINEGFDYVLFGHTHVRIVEKIGSGMYINLGTWLEQPCYGKFTNQKFEIADWVNNGKS